MNRFLLSTLPFIIASGCARSPGGGSSFPGQVLQAMRADTGWIRHLDSLSQTALGPGARCIDPVSHTFSYDGRTWLFNQDWGGVLEIPSDYIPEDDLWQAELSFHGTRAFSPDSMVIISSYAGFQCIGNDDLVQGVREGLEEEGFTIERMERDEKEFRIIAQGAEGIRYYARHLFADGDGVEYAAGVQYPDGREEEAEEIIRMIGRYPLGPVGRPFRGQALQ